MNSLLALLLRYDKDADSESDSEPLFCPNLKTFDLRIKRTSPVWQISYKGFNAQAHLSKSTQSLVVLICHESFQAFSLNFPEPLASRTFIELPGGNLVMEFSSLHEVRLLVVGENHSSEIDIELDRVVETINAIKNCNDDEFAQMAGGVPGDNGKESDSVFYYEVVGAKCNMWGEAFVGVSIFKAALNEAEACLGEPSVEVESSE